VNPRRSTCTSGSRSGLCTRRISEIVRSSDFHHYFLVTPIRLERGDLYLSPVDRSAANQQSRVISVYGKLPGGTRDSVGSPRVRAFGLWPDLPARSVITVAWRFGMRQAHADATIVELREAALARRS
jgi:hypothetical protein